MPPPFSVIIPTYERPERLARCLQAVAQLDYPRDCFETIVVDDGGGEPLGPVVASVRDQISVRLIRQPHSGPAMARNTGTAQARGQFLAFTDDDCEPEGDWLKTLAAFLETHPEHAAGGRTVNALTGNPYSAASQELITYLYRHYNARPNDARFFASNNLALPARAFHELGGFDSKFPFAAGEDRDFCDRWRRSGCLMSYVPEATVRHAHALTFRSFWKQQFDYGRGAFHYHRLRAQRQNRPVGLQPFPFYWNLVLHPLKATPARHPGWLMVLLNIVSQAANGVGYVWESVSETQGGNQRR